MSELQYFTLICNACVCVCVCVCDVFASVHMYSYKVHVDRNYAKKSGGEHVHVYNEQDILKPQYTPFSFSNDYLYGMYI